MALNIFGPRSVKDTLAKELARFRLFLQHPVPMPEGISYENPQYLSTASSSFGNGAILPPIPTEIFRHETSKAGTSDQDEATTITTVLDNLPAHNCVGNIDIDKRIRTTLLGHQTEAVDFIMLRESTEKQATMLWKLESFISEKPIYKHTITGSISPTPKDILGGILGDGMGLGKTLSMIACIASSLAHAGEFVHGSGKADWPARVGCTLVIVPSIYEIKRLILDEAHVIRNWSTKQFKAINDISASIRWCVTGTPVQNSLKDLASLLTFLRIPLLDDPATFRKHIEGKGDTVNSVSKTNYRNLRRLLESICLRRCTSSVLSSLGVSLTERRPHLSESERKGYNELSSLCDRYIKAAVNGKSPKVGNNQILVAVLRLRMFCNMGLLGPTDRSLNDIEDEDRLMPDEVISLLQQCGQAACTSCKIEVSSSDIDADVGKQQDPAHGRLKCGECAQRTLNTQKKRKASQEFQRDQIAANSDIMQGIQFEHGRESVSPANNLHEIPYPSKLLSLADDIRTHYDQDKSIVFSFWRRSLDLVDKLFTEKGIVFGRVDGSIHPSKRSEVLKTFQEDPSIRVLLMTIGAGAVG
ncbi:hypothetical protein EKO27_g5618 [Xylaria grammica]|uniref:Helicase ATP-binding domain-containing protein n=1 Tax=Xylaria grammica TaxID=363999 RepID=A0A439D524_9PEZI|nr:hypothetical protein EKO27_g5618 [Xylaria grammica]